MRASFDIETALYNALTLRQFHASAHALPASLGGELPHVHIVRTGGSTSDRVVETNNVDFDVYSSDASDAMSAAVILCGEVRNLEGEDIGVPVYSSEVSTLPYNNPDPRHPTLGRATFKAQIVTRTVEMERTTDPWLIAQTDTVSILIAHDTD